MGITNWMKSFGTNTLYYPGCLTKGVLKENFENYKFIFNKLGMDFIMLSEEEVCCGLPVVNAGYKKDAKKLAKKNLEIFKAHKIKKIVTNCPSCYHTFKDIYPELLPEWKKEGIEVEHATVTILNLLKKRKFRTDIEPEIVSYHDSCHLGRYCRIYDEPRKVIEMLGGKIIEMKHNRENSLCCGAGAGIRANFPETAKDIAKIRVKDMPERAGKIISACGLCSSNLSSGFSGEDKSEEFSSFVRRKLEVMG